MPTKTTTMKHTLTILTVLLLASLAALHDADTQKNGVKVVRYPKMP